MNPTPAVCQYLPFEAREALRRAAAVEPTKGDPLAKQRALDNTIAKLKLQFPQFFVTEI